MKFVNSSEVTTRNGIPKSRFYRLFLSVSFFVIFALGLYTLGLLPSFVTLKINLPEDDYGSGLWSSISYSIVKQNGRVFESRRYGTVGFANADRSQKAEFLQQYFDRQVRNLGWIAGDDSEICEIYLPEARLLVKRQEAYILQYQEKGYVVYSTGDYFGDLVCVSILPVDPDKNNPDQVFDVIVLTVRQSPIKRLFDFVGAL